MARANRPNFKFEDACEGLVCGIDEVGRGPLAGPVVACAAVIDRLRMPKKILREINDSKQLTRDKREYLFKYLQEYTHFSVAECSVEEIDTINIFHASMLAMKKAFEGLSHAPLVALVDGNKAPQIGCRVQTIVDGDTKSLSIAAASIIAKHYRDTLMRKFAEEFPHYGWHENVGYATPAHIKAIEIHGITRLHRRSFSIVSKNSDKERSVNT